MEKATKDSLVASITQEANGFYNSLLSIVTAFLGGSLLFLKEVIHDLPPRALPILFLGWGSLVICLMSLVIVRYLNLLSGKYALAEKFESARAHDRCKERLCVFSIVAMGLGISGIIIFGALNFPR